MSSRTSFCQVMVRHKVLLCYLMLDNETILRLPKPQIALKNPNCSVMFYTKSCQRTNSSRNPRLVSKSSDPCMYVMFDALTNERTFPARWLPYARLMVARRRHCMVAAGGAVFAVGGLGQRGRTLDSVERYDRVKDAWTEVGRLDHAVMSAGAVGYSGHVLVFGGTKNQRVAVDCVQCFDPITRQCSALSALPRPLGLCRAVLCSGHVIVLEKRDTFVYDIADNSWSARSRHRTGVDQFSCVVDADDVYVVGGRGVDGRFSADIRRVSALSVIGGSAGETWHTVGQLPRPMMVFAAEVVTMSRR